MTTTLHPRSDRLKSGWSRVWNDVRAPLNKLISYGELVAEEATGDESVFIREQIDELLITCEAILHHTQATFDLPTTEGVNPLEALSQSLLRYHVRLQEIAVELERLSAGELAEDLRNDLRIICQSVLLLGATFASLNVDPGLEQATPIARETRDVPVHSVPRSNQLIAQVEYLGLLLVVDDDEGNRDVLSRRLMRDGYEVMLAESGPQALRMLNRYNFDLVLLDIMMPGMDGITMLNELRRNPQLTQLPVIMITAVDEVEAIVRCIEAGADDYLSKPFNPVLLRARIHALLERKRLLDEQKRQRQELELVLENSRRNAERAEQMLLNILPAVVAEELREFGSVKPMYFEDITIVFADIVGFTLSTEQMPADELVELLHHYFTECDKIVARYGLEKLKTIGDSYMFAGGLPVRNPSHPVDCVLAATEMIGAMAELNVTRDVPWQLRVGVHTGPVIAGVVGIHKFAFDIWGDAVNFASRVESCGASGRINLSHSTFTRVKDFFACEKRERVRIKEGKEVEMYFVQAVAASLLNKPNKSSLEAFQTRYETFFRKAMQTYPEAMFLPRPGTGA